MEFLLLRFQATNSDDTSSCLFALITFQLEERAVRLHTETHRLHVKNRFSIVFAWKTCCKSDQPRHHRIMSSDILVIRHKMSRTALKNLSILTQLMVGNSAIHHDLHQLDFVLTVDAKYV